MRELGAIKWVFVNRRWQAQQVSFPEDFTPFNFSAKEMITGGVVFAGYGITAPEYNYDDYAGIDVKDKIVLILRHEPQEFDDKSVFEGKSLTDTRTFWRRPRTPRCMARAA